ncbi:2OG-Fe(II) oxygenase [Leisingera methylohalidivorans]|uniref:Oxidoreductase n=1 Tax=Leisingera methylohalidivorans DSM 14336 TaxID=999552 RepID=V9VQ70_9RHOB|nr:2OG-Fe(II) oxygenase [Leisingera methylohalidivorans]AHD00168.1 oxidoreductase [Leisingera methylohalidivorans DSM 14336]
MVSVYSVPNAFSALECAEISRKVNAEPESEARLVGQTRDHNLRRADVVWLDDVPGTGWVMDRLISLVRRANRELFNFDLREFAESPQAAGYKAKDGGHFAWHSDIGDGPVAGKRKLTLMVQLSKPGAYDGGDLEVMPGAHVVAASRAQGSVTVFPSFLLHQVTPVTRGARQSLTVWAHGPAFR